MTEVSTMGALSALTIAIVLILRKVPPVYGMLIGALLGGLIGGVDIVSVVDMMVKGAGSIVPAVLRILAAGILAGVLMASGAATSIAETVVRVVGEKRVLFALALATLVLTAVGVFVDVSVITVSPIALAIARDAKLSRTAVLLAMIGGGQAGNIMSPNPNTIAAADAFDLPLTSVMAAGVIPAVFGLIVAYFIARALSSTGSMVQAADVPTTEDQAIPGFWPAMVAPLVTIALLTLRPIAGIAIDPMVALPVGGLIGALAMGRIRNLNDYATIGLGKMAGVAIMLVGTGTLAGIVASSGLKTSITDGLTALGLPAYMLAPVSGALMSIATASTTAGTVVAVNVFSHTLLELGVSALAAAAMIHSGATMGDHMPHGSFFHATAGATGMSIGERLKLIPYESLVVLTLALVSTLLFGVFAVF